MKKYLLVLMVVVLSLSAQTPQLDSPQQVYTGNLHFMSITVTGNYFTNFTIANIIQLLSGMRKSDHTSGKSDNWWSIGWADQAEYDNALKDLVAELKAYYNSFPASSEVLSASLNNGQTVYATSFGEIVGGELSSSNVSVNQNDGEGMAIVTINGHDYDANDVQIVDNTKEQDIYVGKPEVTLNKEYVDANGNSISVEKYEQYVTEYQNALTEYQNALNQKTLTEQELQNLEAKLTAAQEAAEAAQTALTNAQSTKDLADTAASEAAQALADAQNDKKDKDAAAEAAQTALTNAQNDKNIADILASEAAQALADAQSAKDLADTAASEAAQALADAQNNEATDPAEIERLTNELTNANAVAEAAQTALTNAQNDKNDKDAAAEAAQTALTNAQNDKNDKDATVQAQELAISKQEEVNRQAQNTVDEKKENSELKEAEKKQYNYHEYTTYSVENANGEKIDTDAQGYQIDAQGNREKETVKDGTQTAYLLNEDGTKTEIATVQTNSEAIKKSNISDGRNYYIDQSGKKTMLESFVATSVKRLETDENNLSNSTLAQKSLYEAEQETSQEPAQTLTFYAGRNSSSALKDGWGYGGSNASVTKDKATSVLTIKTKTGKTYNIQAYSTTTPLVLDMDGDGKLEASKGQHLPHNLTTDPANMVNFDINGDGFDELVEWVGPNDGLLVRYTEGEEMTGLNLFGSATGFQDGYQSLSVLDTNKDKVISGAELEGLSVWQDANGNAKVDAGEIKTVQALGITEINVTHIGLKSSFLRNGKYATMWDWHPCTIVVRKMD